MKMKTTGNLTSIYWYLPTSTIRDPYPHQGVLIVIWSLWLLPAQDSDVKQVLETHDSRQHCVFKCGQDRIDLFSPTV